MNTSMPFFLTNIYNNYIPEHVTNIYLFCEQESLNECMFNQLQNLPNLECIFILDSAPLSGYIGFEELQNILVHKYKIDYRMIVAVPFLYQHENMINTYTESKSLCEYLYKKDIKDLIILAPVFHLPRAVISFVSVLIKEFPNEKHINIYSLAGNLNNWTTVEYIHSQGTLRGTVNELILSEMKRIECYTKKGDLLPIDKILEYIQK